MVDPVTLASGAVAGFQLLKKGFGAGRDLHQMGSELNQVLDYITGVEQAKKQNKKRYTFYNRSNHDESYRFRIYPANGFR